MSGQDDFGPDFWKDLMENLEKEEGQFGPPHVENYVGRECNISQEELGQFKEDIKQMKEENGVGS